MKEKCKRKIWLAHLFTAFRLILAVSALSLHVYECVNSL